MWKSSTNVSSNLNKSSIYPIRIHKERCSYCKREHKYTHKSYFQLYIIYLPFSFFFFFFVRGKIIIIVFVPATDGDLSFSPILGVFLGGTLTVVVVVLLIIIRIRRSKSHKEDNMEHKVGGGSVQPQHNTLSSTKPLLRSTSPKDADDPDIIPAKYGKTIVLLFSLCTSRVIFDWVGNWYKGKY